VSALSLSQSLKILLISPVNHLNYFQDKTNKKLMKKYRLINNITGWVIFTVAAVTYLLTIEPTASLWDCGEYIASAYKMEVGHPPGNPVFMVIARFFTLFAGGNTSHVATMVNSVFPGSRRSWVQVLLERLHSLFLIHSGFQLLKERSMHLLHSSPHLFSGQYLGGKMWLTKNTQTGG
jgi:hypothetical protein